MFEDSKVNNNYILDNNSDNKSKNSSASSESTSSKENKVYYDNSNLLKISYERALIDLRKLPINNILKIFKKNTKIINYADIYQYINSKNLNENKPLWTSSFKHIKNKNKSSLKNKKSSFPKAFKNFFINYEYKRLYQIELLILCLMVNHF